MFFLGHIGITLGAAVLGSGVYSWFQTRRESPEMSKTAASSSSVRTRLTNGGGSHEKPLRSHLGSCFKNLNSYLDIRFLLIGSMLPDIIDKPVGNFFFRDTFHNGRIFSHTILFLILVSLIGLFVFRKWGKTWFLALAFGTLFHLILDYMWAAPQTLFWPLLGWSFPNYGEYDVLGSYWSSLFHNSGVFIPEIIGVAAILVLVIFLLRRKQFRNFLFKGRI